MGSGISALRLTFDRKFNSTVFGAVLRRRGVWRFATVFAPRLGFRAVAAIFLALFARLLAAFCTLAVAPFLAPLRCPFTAARFAFALLAVVDLAPVRPRFAAARDGAFALAAPFLALPGLPLAAALFETGRFFRDRAADKGFDLAWLDFAVLNFVFFFADFFCAAMAELSMRARSSAPVVGPTIYERLL
jgi:hypothetical protein